ncbi:DNA-processing protein DprA [Thermithiobacillus plumbiphilus]|uniref:DNA-processing protein DprA n=1 Tax=Thermithiobacillus plumbiphilus TaxID=1729899 RepID=A0ABU9D7U7_9PROT
MKRSVWLALRRLPGLGQRRLAALLEHFGDAEGLFQADSTAWRAAGLNKSQIQGLEKGPEALLTAADAAWLGDPTNDLLTLADDDYPPLLRQLPDAPPVLYLRGQRTLLSRPMLAIVGSRHATPQGAANAQAFARHLSEAGFNIVSGLATGIDAAAHRGALEGSGATLAVMGTGPDCIYPRQHEQLAARIAETGLILTDYPPGTPVRAALFPQRNRIISGLSMGVLVVEAAIRSGSLVTARLAADQGREVFALPGSIHNPLSRGPHHLIRQGAKLVESVQDILEELGHLHAFAATRPQRGPDSPEDAELAALLEVLGYEPQTLDVLVERSGLTPDRVSAMLLTLELDAWIASSPGGRYQRLPREA